MKSPKNYRDKKPTVCKFCIHVHYYNGIWFCWREFHVRCQEDLLRKDDEIMAECKIGGHVVDCYQCTYGCDRFKRNEFKVKELE